MNYKQNYLKEIFKYKTGLYQTFILPLEYYHDQLLKSQNLNYFIY